MLVIKMIKEILSILFILAMCVGLYFQQSWVVISWFILLLAAIALIGFINCTLNDDEVLNEEQVKEALKAFPNDKPYTLIGSTIVGVVTGVMLITGHYLLAMCYVLNGILYYVTHIKVRTIIKKNGGVK